MDDGSRERLPRTEAGPNLFDAPFVSWRFAGRWEALVTCGVVAGVKFAVVVVGELSSPRPLAPGLASVLGLWWLAGPAAMAYAWGRP